MPSSAAASSSASAGVKRPRRDSAEETEEIAKYACAVCMEVVTDCHSSTCCGAVFCGECKTVLEQEDRNLWPAEGRRPCPHCRKKAPCYVKNLAFQRLANEVEVVCPEERCGVRSKVGERHCDWCPWATTECSLSWMGCRWTGPRKNLKQHMEDCHAPRCRQRPCCPGKLQQLPQNVCETVGTGSFCDTCGCAPRKDSGHTWYGCDVDDCDYLECSSCLIHRPLRTMLLGVDGLVRDKGDLRPRFEDGAGAF
ncbi:unnamed protein product [Amoebophrya sp. A120]|nr:unnamed protein product [Amoebophrya sp. A120]|eukprot:GSA120T00001138001.1